MLTVYNNGGYTIVSTFPPMANNPLLTVRVPPYIIKFIEELADKSNRTKTETVISLLESSDEFKEFQKAQGIQDREPTVSERLDSIQTQLQALQEASNFSPDSSILQTAENSLKAILEKTKNNQKGYQTNSFAAGLKDIRYLVHFLEQRHD